MGNFFANLFEKAFPKKVNILMVGLDAGGKTTILYKLKFGEVTTIKSETNSWFTVETCNSKTSNWDTTIYCWDVTNDHKNRNLYKHYYENANAIIFVIDSNDKERMAEAKEALDTLKNEKELKDCPLLVFAHKQDLPNAMSADQVTKTLQLDKIENRKWKVEASMGNTGMGLYEGLDWISQVLTGKA